jgi:hypothetical protein
MPKVSKDDFKPYFEIELDKSYGPSEREAIAQEVIDEIVTRTEGGLDADNKKFVGYSKLYAREKGQSNVDLTFSGEMLSEIKLLQSKSGKIRIGFDKGYEGIGKVEGNILGTYGNERPVNKGRNFLGITDQDLKGILSNYKGKSSAEEVSQATEAAKRLTGTFEEDDGDT